MLLSALVGVSGGDVRACTTTSLSNIVGVIFGKSRTRQLCWFEGVTRDIITQPRLKRQRRLRFDHIIIVHCVISSTCSLKDDFSYEVSKGH